MALISEESFEAARARAEAEWRARGDADTAALFAALTLGRCGFGLQSGLRVCWATVEGRRIGLLFSLEDGTYLRSFAVKQAGPRPAP